MLDGGRCSISVKGVQCVFETLILMIIVKILGPTRSIIFKWTFLPIQFASIDVKPFCDKMHELFTKDPFVSLTFPGTENKGTAYASGQDGEPGIPRMYTEWKLFSQHARLHEIDVASNIDTLIPHAVNVERVKKGSRNINLKNKFVLTILILKLCKTV